MSDTTYNGWKNYPTWAVNLWLSNEEPLYRDALERVNDAHVGIANIDQVTSGIWTVEQALRFTVADDLKAWVTDDLMPDLGASVSADLLGYALDCVDWHEIADVWIESTSEQVRP